MLGRYLEHKIIGGRSRAEFYVVLTYIPSSEWLEIRTDILAPEKMGEHIHTEPKNLMIHENGEEHLIAESAQLEKGIITSDTRINTNKPFEKIEHLTLRCLIDLRTKP